MAFLVSVFVVLVLALLPPQVHMPSTGWDKANHALVFVVLAILGCRAYPEGKPAVLLSLVGYGALIEVLQGLTGYRTAEWLDLAADGIGLLCGWQCQYRSKQ
jgi:VanZ family protein